MRYGVLHGGRTSVGLGNRADDGQTQAESLVSLGYDATTKALEDHSLVLVSHTRTAVANPQPEAVLNIDPGADRDHGVGLGA